MIPLPFLLVFFGIRQVWSMWEDSGYISDEDILNRDLKRGGLNNVPQPLQKGLVKTMFWFGVFATHEEGYPKIQYARRLASIWDSVQHGFVLQILKSDSNRAVIWEPDSRQLTQSWTAAPNPVLLSNHNYRNSFRVGDYMCIGPDSFLGLNPSEKNVLPFAEIAAKFSSEAQDSIRKYHETCFGYEIRCVEDWDSGTLVPVGGGRHHLIYHRFNFTVYASCCRSYDSAEQGCRLQQKHKNRCLYYIYDHKTGADIYVPGNIQLCSNCGEKNNIFFRSDVILPIIEGSDPLLGMRDSYKGKVEKWDFPNNKVAGTDPPTTPRKPVSFVHYDELSLDAFVYRDTELSDSSSPRSAFLLPVFLIVFLFNYS